MKQSKLLLSVVIPVFNEEKTVEKTLHKVIDHLEKIANRKPFKEHRLYSQIVVVDDGSIDGTKKILKKYKKEKKIKIITHKTNLGKGAALKTGFKKADGDILLIQDADLEYDPKYYSKLITPIIKENKNVVYGSRLRHIPFNLKSITSIELPLHFIANKFLSLVTSILYGQTITDMETGYKVFRKKVLKNITLNSSGFEIEVELTSKIIRQGFAIHEVDITTKPRDYNEGKKITFFDGVKACYYLLYYRFFS